MNTGYDVVLWKEINGHMTVTKMAQYDLKKDIFIITDQETRNEFRNLKVIVGCFAAFESIGTLTATVLDPMRTSSNASTCSLSPTFLLKFHGQLVFQSLVHTLNSFAPTPLAILIRPKQSPG